MWHMISAKYRKMSRIKVLGKKGNAELELKGGIGAGGGKRSVIDLAETV